MSSQLREHIVTTLAAPLAHTALSSQLQQDDAEEHMRVLAEWLRQVEDLGDDIRYTQPRDQPNEGLRIEIKAPVRGRVCFFPVYAEDVEEDIETVARPLAEVDDDLLVLMLCVDAALPQGQELVEACFEAARRINDERLLVMEPSWTTAILVERSKPLLPGSLEQAGKLAPTTYFDSSSPGRRRVRLRRTEAAAQSLTLVDTGQFRDKLEEVLNAPVPDAPIHLCTTFLPPITHSQKAVKRFYQHEGVRKSTIQMLTTRAQYELDTWTRHIRSHPRIDVIDRVQLDEYLAAPDYYQMPLSPSELKEQIGNLERLLQHDNYRLCLTSQAVDIPFEIRGDEVHIRTDRRNKGQPRPGRINSLIFREPTIRDAFEREFYASMRLTEPEFLDKEFITDWLQERLRRYRIIQSQERTHEPFDVFLCHNSQDKPSVRQVARALQKEGLRPWFDEWNAPPGTQWIWELEKQIQSIKSAAVFIGANGLGPWQRQEVAGLLLRFAKRDCPIIPVILKSGEEPLEMPSFLAAISYVDMRKRAPSKQIAEAVRHLTMPSSP
jgi:hypothetical protein